MADEDEHREMGELVSHCPLGGLFKQSRGDGVCLAGCR